MKNKLKTVKAWAILHKSRKRIEDDGNKHLYIYSHDPAWDTNGRVVECTITYSPQ